MTSLTGSSAESLTYLDRRDRREGVQTLKRTIVFGLVLGWMMVLVFGFQWYYTRNFSDDLMFALMCAGGLVLAITVIIPTILIPVERNWTHVASYIGKAFFGIMLTILYLLFTTPFGWIERLFRGSTAPFYSWDPARGEHAPADMEGWRAKVIPAELEAPAEIKVLPDGQHKLVTRGKSGSHLPLILQPLRVLGYFVRQGQWALIPLLILLLALGLLMFFVQSSSLAPFIYTLF